MRLEYLTGAAGRESLVRLSHFTPTEAAELHSAALGLVQGTATMVAVHDLPSVQAVDGCRLALRVGAWDQGLTRISPCVFHFVLQQDRWEDIAGLIEPFAREALTGFQWLTTAADELPLLFSPTGDW